MYGQYKEDLGKFARTYAQKLRGKSKLEKKFLPEKYTKLIKGLCCDDVLPFIPNQIILLSLIALMHYLLFLDW